MKSINEDEAELLIEEHLRIQGWDLTDFTLTRKRWREHLDGDEADRVFLHDGKIVAILEAKKPGKDLWAALDQAKWYARAYKRNSGHDVLLLFASDGKTYLRQNIKANTLPERVSTFPTPPEFREFFHPQAAELHGILRDYQRIGEAKHMLPLWLAQTQVQTTQKGQEVGRMLYNELEQGDILSGVRFGLALLAYTDILLCSIWAIHRIRQSPVQSFDNLCYPMRCGTFPQRRKRRLSHWSYNFLVRSRSCETVSEMGQTKPHVSWEACSALSPWWHAVGGTLWCPFAPKIGRLFIKANFWLTIVVSAA